MSIESIYSVYRQHPHIQTDTRKLKAGEIFIALKGPNFNGNRFAAQALDQGAVLVVTDEETNIRDPRVIRVEDGLKALQDLALHHRKTFTIPFIAITGSNGKTTTKELVHAVLSTTYKTYTTQGNLNNHIGVPLTILSVRADAGLAVIEMGANHQKEIEGYCKVALPTHGIITNCGKAHLEGFGGIEGVRKGKGELYDFLRANGGTAFVNWDYDYLQSMSRGIKEIIRYGTTAGEVTGKVSKNEPFLEVEIFNDKPLSIPTQMVGDYNLPNVLVAVTVGRYFGVPEDAIRSAISDYEPSNSRSQLVKKGNNEIILDAYNANPTSMRAALENFARHQHDNKTVFLGAMMELGESSLTEHSDIISLLQNLKLKNAVLVGGDFGKVEHPFLYFPDVDKALQWAREQHLEHSLILIKGSRSVKMEKLLDAF